jgi:hypothetical protein
MRRILFITTLFAFILTSTAWAADISGNWTLKMSGRQGDVTMDLAIKAAGENLTITTKHPMMGDMAGTGTLKGNAITMDVTATGEMKMGFKFTGTVTGNKMAGTREIVRPAGMMPMGGGQGGAPAGGQGSAPAGGAAGAPAGAAAGAPAGGQAGAPAAGAQGMMQGGQGGTPMANVSNAWTAEKK